MKTVTTASWAVLALSALAVARPTYELGGKQSLIRRQDQDPQQPDGGDNGDGGNDDSGSDADQGIIQIPSPVQHSGNVDACQGYQLTSAETLDGGIDGVLELIGNCSAYGPDYNRLNLKVRYESDERLRVQIRDADNQAHTVPTGTDYSIGEWKEIADGASTNDSSKLEFRWQENPFSFSVVSKSNNVTIFDTSSAALIFEEQYLRLRTLLPENSHIQGLGQHNDNFTLPISQENYVRTIWARDSYGVPTYTNLYGSHPVYINQITGENPSAHGVFLLNSNGMDVKFPEGGQFLEYNVLGGIFDLYFFAGPTPAEASKQYVELIGKPAEAPYWALGFHQCRYGTNDVVEAAETVANYSAAQIPLETQWLDIDYMFQRWGMTLDENRFELAKMQYFVDQLKAKDQHLVMMINPSVASGREQDDVSNYEFLQNGIQQDVFMKHPVSQCPVYSPQRPERLMCFVPTAPQ